MSAPYKAERAAGRTSGARTVHPPAAHAVAYARAAPLLQPKLTVGRPDDEYEREADRIADEVMRMPDPAAGSAGVERARIRSPVVQRVCSQCEGEEKLQCREQSPGAGTEGFNLDAVDATLRRPGRPLDAAARAFFEPRFGVDFGAVRVHTDAQAADSARGVDALAYTVGRDVVFGAGQYAPHGESGRRLLAHELTHVVQQASAPRLVQRDIADDLRVEADLPPSRRTPGRLGELETRAREDADTRFQEATGRDPLASGTLGRGVAIIQHVKDEADRLEMARANGFQDAVFDMLSEDLAAADTTAFWIAFAGNTIWALSSLVPLAGPALVGTRFAATVLGRILVPVLQRGAGAYATTAVGLAGAQIAQWSGGGPPSASSMPRTRAQIRDQFNAANAATIARLKTEVHALASEVLTELAAHRAALIDESITAAALENTVKEQLIRSLFSSLYAANGIDGSNHTIRTDVATRLAKNDLLQAYALTHGAIRDQRFSDTDAFEDRPGAEGTATAVSLLGGTGEFASRLRGDYELVVGNINGTLADWGAQNTLSPATLDNWSTTNTLASGSFSVPFNIVDAEAFTSQLNGDNHTPDSRATRSIRGLRGRGGRWVSNVLPRTGLASFSSSAYSSLGMGGRAVHGLDGLRLEFVPRGSYSLYLSERSAIEPGTRGTAVFDFTSGNTEAVVAEINPDVAS